MPEAKRRLVDETVNRFGLSKRRACDLLRLGRSTCNYRPKPNNDEQVIKRLKELAMEKRGDMVVVDSIFCCRKKDWL